MLKNILIFVFVVLVCILLYAATKPGSFRIERSTIIHAAPDKIFANLNDFHNWKNWSPWENIDPSLKRDITGPQSGQGSHYAWSGNNQIGQGSMEITDSTPSSHLGISLDFIKPFKSHSDVEFILEPQGDSTKVTWAMFGPRPYVGKLITVFMDCDSYVGKTYEQGLSKLKEVSEK